MFARCRMCGKVTIDWARRGKGCPRCGSAVSKQGTNVEPRARSGFGFPPRGNSSLEDRLRQQKQELLEIKGVGSSQVYADWYEVVKSRPMDVPLYTGLKGRACILVLVSSQSIRSSDLIKAALASKRPLAMQSEAFLKGPYPVLRCNLVLPDNPDDPLILESPLDVADGNVQDFCNAVMEDETVDIMLTHEQVADRMYAFAVRASGLGEALKREVSRVLAALRPAATRQEFQKSVKMMEAVYPCGSSGVSPQKCVRLEMVGEARHTHIEY